jgi:hypothetical protein
MTISNINKWDCLLWLSERTKLDDRTLRALKEYIAINGTPIDNYSMECILPEGYELVFYMSEDTCIIYLYDPELCCKLGSFKE